MQCDILEKQTKPHVIKENLKQIELHYVFTWNKDIHDVCDDHNNYLSNY